MALGDDIPVSPNAPSLQGLPESVRRAIEGIREGSIREQAAKTERTSRTKELMSRGFAEEWREAMKAGTEKPTQAFIREQASQQKAAQDFAQAQAGWWGVDPNFRVLKEPPPVSSPRDVSAILASARGPTRAQEAGLAYQESLRPGGGGGWLGERPDTTPRSGVQPLITQPPPPPQISGDGPLDAEIVDFDLRRDARHLPFGRLQQLGMNRSSEFMKDRMSLIHERTGITPVELGIGAAAKGYDIGAPLIGAAISAPTGVTRAGLSAVLATPNPAAVAAAPFNLAAGSANAAAPVGGAIGGAAGFMLGGPVGAAVGAAIGGGIFQGIGGIFEDLGGIVTEVDERFQALSKDLAEFNGMVAVGEGFAQFIDIQSKIQQGQRIGGGLADITIKRAEVAAILRDIQTDFLEPLLPLIEGGLGELKDLLKVINKHVSPEMISAVMEAILTQGAENVAILFGIPGAPFISEWMKKVLEELRRRAAEDNVPRTLSQEIDDFLRNKPGTAFQDPRPFMPKTQPGGRIPGGGRGIMGGP